VIAPDHQLELRDISKPAQRGVQRPVGNRAMPRADLRKKVGRRAGHLAKVGDDRKRLPRQRHLVRPRHLHLFLRNVPDRAAHVEFVPFGVPQFARADEGKGDQLQRCARCDLPVYVVDRAQKRADRLRLGDSGPVIDLWCYERADKISRRITLGSIGAYRIFENTTANPDISQD
jgi:hypothetical protein